MDRKQALNQLRIMQAWHEDNGNGPNADYDAICYAIGVIEAQPNGMDTLIKALEAEHKKLLEMQKALKNVPDTNVGDTISRQAAIDVLDAYQVKIENGEENPYAWARLRMSELPPAQPDAVTASLEELINDYGEDGYFIIDGVNYQANELLNELKINSSVGEKFRKQITKTIVQYFMKFGG